MHTEHPKAPRSAEPSPAGQEAQVFQQPGMARLYLEQRQRARRTAAWVGALAVLVYVGFILSGVIGR